MKWWVLTAAILCGFFGALPAPAEALPQSAPTSPQSQADTTPRKPAAHATTKKKPANRPAPTGKTQTHKATAAAAKKPASSAATHRSVSTRKRTISPRVARMRQAFVASASLRPMAQQLLQDRSLPAYAGVDAYARIHAKED